MRCMNEATVLMQHSMNIGGQIDRVQAHIQTNRHVIATCLTSTEVQLNAEQTQTLVPNIQSRLRPSDNRLLVVWRPVCFHLLLFPKVNSTITCFCEE